MVTGRPDYRSEAAKAWRGLYSTAAWKRKRREQLTREPLCRFCLERGEVTEAKVADHIKAHKGDLDLFYFGELQSLCVPCHNATKQQIEARGYSCVAGLDGYPLDPNHPFNKPRKAA